MDLRQILIKKKKGPSSESHSVHWVVNHPLSKAPPPFLAKPPLKSANCLGSPFEAFPLHIVSS